MPRTFTITVPDQEREEYLSAQPLCEHSVEVGKAIMVQRLGLHGMHLVHAYQTIPRWKVFARWKARMHLIAAREVAMAVLDGEDDDE